MNEAIVEEAALGWLQSLGWVISHGRELGPDAVDAERHTYEQVLLEGRLQRALVALNPTLPAEAIYEAFRKLTRPEGPTLETRNRAFRRMLVDGVTVEFRREDGSIGGATGFSTPYGISREPSLWPCRATRPFASGTT